MTGTTPIRDRAPGAADLCGDPGARSDEELVASLREGRHDAFEALAVRYERRLLWFCRRMLRSREDAEDAVQDVFVSAYRAILADERSIHVGPWLYRIASNRCINQLRRASTVALDSIDEPRAGHGSALIDGVLSRERLRELVGDIATLPDTQRTALLLCEVDGLTYHQIARAAGTTVPAVKSLLVRARAGLTAAALLRDATLDAHRQHRRAGRATPDYQAARATLLLAA